ncbi:ATP-binding cassette domain-containing protein [Paenibacillus sp. BR2-3]|uniref:ABC transporter ATP-binding protein n=1 Tax=Paenibacillus sp. BR2-3 TaxID=3048494 RepID=UPI00397791BB
MAIIQAERLSFRYPDQERDSLHELSFTLKEGEFVVLCGPSGSGKTTLLRHLKRELAPVGTRSGGLWYKGQPLDELRPETAAEEIGMVFQNPEAQIVMDTVWHELAFSMENMGYPPAVMRSRLAEIAGLFGLEPLLYKPVHELSGGQKQLLNLASVLLLRPKLLLLDEPTSQLDPVAAREFIHMLHRLNEEMSMTVIISEHRLEEVFPLADRVLLMEQGSLKAEGTPRELVHWLGQEGPQSHVSYLPTASRLFLALSPEEERITETVVPLTIREGKRWLQNRAGMLKNTGGAETVAINESPRKSKDSLLTCFEVTFRYEKNGPEVLKKLSLSLYRNELLAILGGNGAGKSTLLQLMAGLSRPQRGRLTLAKGITAGYLAQNPLLYFSQDTVSGELLHMARYAELSESHAQQEIAKLLDLFQLHEIYDSHPLDISGGQQQKVALAMVLLLSPGILLLDEPTKGLDPGAKERLATLLKLLCDEGKSVVIVTHDVEFAAKYASRCAMLFDGSITAEGSPEIFFSANYFYTTAVNRIVRDWLPQALTIEDVK